ncbi:MAG: YggT family protein [Chloroflexi bacterium]|nr:YggT family protein [Chloroflexota bacterium]
MQVLGAVLQIFVFVILARALLSWFPGAQRSQLGVILFNVTEPILAPLRRILPTFGMMDLSPLVAIIVLQVIARVLLDSG